MTYHSQWVFGFGFSKCNLSLYEEAVFDIPCVYRLNFHMSYQATVVQLAESMRRCTSPWFDDPFRSSFSCLAFTPTDNANPLCKALLHSHRPWIPDFRRSRDIWMGVSVHLGGISSAFFSCIAHPSPNCAAGACVTRASETGPRLPAHTLLPLSRLALKLWPVSAL